MATTYLSTCIALTYLMKSLSENNLQLTLWRLNNNNLNSKQSGSRPVDSCVHRLITITRDIYKTFDTNPRLEMRGVFLDLSKALDKVWLKGLLYKLRRMGVCENYFRCSSGSSTRVVITLSLHILIIYQKTSMILWSSWWFQALLSHHYLLMRTYPEYCSGHTNWKFCLILMLQNRLKRSFSRERKSF